MFAKGGVAGKIGKVYNKNLRKQTKKYPFFFI